MTDFEKKLEEYYFTRFNDNLPLLIEERGIVDFKSIIDSIIEELKKTVCVRIHRNVNNQVVWQYNYIANIQVNTDWLDCVKIHVTILNNISGKNDGRFRMSDSEVVDGKIPQVLFIVNQYNQTPNIDFDKLTTTLWHELHHAYRYVKSFGNSKEVQSKDRYFKMMALFDSDFSKSDTIVQTIVSAYYNTDEDEINAQAASTYEYVLNHSEITPQNYKKDYYHTLPLYRNISNAQLALNYLNAYLDLDENTFKEEIEKFNSYCSKKNIDIAFNRKTFRQTKVKVESRFVYAQNQLFKVLGKAFMDRGLIHEEINMEVTINDKFKKL